MLEIKSKKKKKPDKKHRFFIWKRNEKKNPNHLFFFSGLRDLFLCGTLKSTAAAAAAAAVRLENIFIAHNQQTCKLGRLYFPQSSDQALQVLCVFFIHKFMMRGRRYQPASQPAIHPTYTINR